MAGPAGPAGRGSGGRINPGFLRSRQGPVGHIFDFQRA